MNLTSEEQQRLLETVDRLVVQYPLIVDDLIDALEIIAALANNNISLDVVLSEAMKNNPLILLHATSELGVEGLAERLVSKSQVSPPREGSVKAKAEFIRQKQKQWGQPS